MQGSIAPASLDEAAAWAGANGRDLPEAERRFYLITIVRAIATDPELSQRLVLRGSGAIWLRFLPDRLPNDLDYIDLARPSGGAPPEPVEQFEARVRQRLGRYFRETLPANHVARAIRGAQSTVGLELSPTYMPVPIEFHAIGSDVPPVRTCELAYKFAEKVCALADQRRRDRERFKDIVDCFEIGRHHPASLDGRRVMELVVARQRVQPGQRVDADFFDGPLRRWVMKRLPEPSRRGAQVAWSWLVEFLRTHA